MATFKKEDLHSLTSPYALTVMILAAIKTTQNIKLSAHPGKLFVQYCSTICKATKSAAVETASLNQ
jgi:hypothetical protein